MSPEQITELTDVIVCAHNEQPYIGDVLDAIVQAPSLGQLIVVADNCDDYTASIAAGYTTEVIPIAAQDKGTAMATGLGQVQTEHVCFIDADLSGLRPEHVEALLTLEPLRGQVVGIRGESVAGTPIPRPLGLLPSLSGERRLPTDLATSVRLAGQGWKAETLINAAVARARLPWRHVMLWGVANRSKAIRSPLAWTDEVVRVGVATAQNLPALVRYQTHPNG